MPDMIYSNCSDSLEIFTREAYERYKKNSVDFLWEAIRGRRVEGYYSLGYVNPMEQLDLIIGYIGKGAYIIEYEPLNWPFEIEPVRTAGRDDESIDERYWDLLEGTFKFPPLYVSRELLPSTVATLRREVKAARKLLPGSYDFYRAYYKLYKAALESGVEGAGLVTGVAGIMVNPKLERRVAVIVKREGKVCYKTSQYGRLRLLPGRVLRLWGEVVDMC